MTLREQYAQKHSLLDVLRSHGVQLKGDGDQRKAQCPFHKDKTPSFSVNLKEGSWQCFAGCGNGGVIELAAKFAHSSPEQILDDFAKDNGQTKRNGSITRYIDWNACVDAFTDDHKAKLAEWRGYRPEFVDLLVQEKLVGIANGNIAFPITAAGRVTGTHQKIKGGAWVTRGGTDKPWIIGNDHFDTVLLFESQWDAFAFMDATRWLETNMRAFSSIVITRGANKAKSVKNLFPTSGDIIAWMQNDPEDDEGDSPAKSWLADLTQTIGRVKAAWPPEPHKDLNDWTRAGALSADILQLMESALIYRNPSLPPLKPHLSFRKMLRFDPLNDDSCLLGQRYLCKGGSAIWVGASGLGKSVLALQAAITFALNDSLFGLQPRKPLRSVILSAEDDEGDLSETFQGVIKAFGITESDPRFDIIMDSVFIYQESELKGLKAISYAEQLVLENKANFLWLNPLLSFYTGNPSDPEKSSEFTGALSAVQFNTGVCSMLVHHTGKPKEAKSTKDWSIDDFSYIGLGSSVWTNWARAITVLQALPKHPGTFVLRFAKRGNRTGIIDDNFNPIRQVYLQHSTSGLCWLLSDFIPDSKSNAGRPPKLRWELVDKEWSGEPLSNADFHLIVSRITGCAPKTAANISGKWAGIHIVKNTNDLWVKSDHLSHNSI